MKLAKYISFVSRDELVRIDLTSVVYFEADGNYTKIVSINDLISMTCMNLGRIGHLLSIHFKDAPVIFVRVGKRYILNIEFIYRINILKQELILSDQRSFSKTISVSKSALKALKELLSSHLKDNMDND